MVTVIKIFVKFIKLLIVFFKATEGPLADFAEYLEEKYGITGEE